MVVYIKEASSAWNILNGVFNIFKPAGIHPYRVRGTIITNLCRDLNELEVRPQMKHVSIEGPTNEEMKVVVRDSYADHPLVVGPRYTHEDFKMSIANYMSTECSGIMICGVNSGFYYTNRLRQSKLTKFYRLQGTLGQMRDGHYKTGKILEKTTWKKVKRGLIDQICASMQAAHQKKMFENCGVDMQSQAAYELAIKGPVRPADPNIPMIYSIKCVEFKPPEFTIEMVCINENEEYLKSLIFEIGKRAKSSAHCSFIQCSQYGHFSIKDSLLSKHWNLECILNSVSDCHKILKEHPYMLAQDNANLVPVKAVAQQ